MNRLPRPLLQRFQTFDLRGKIAALFMAAALTLGAGAMLAAVAITRLLAMEHGQELHFLTDLLPVFLVIGIGVVALMAYLAGISARLISAPLIEIAAAAEAIADSGRPSGELPVRHHDEFGRLSAAFNTMVKRLAESYAELEQRVAERTREYEESQQEAQHASNLLREAVQHVAVGFTIYDQNDRLALCNEAYLRIYEDSRDLIVPGASFEEIVRKGAERGQYREAVGHVEEWVRQRVAQHQSAQGEVIEQKLGNNRWLLIVEHRTPSGYIVGNRIDITPLKSATESLRTTLDQLNAIFELSPDGFVSFDRAGRIKYASPAFMRMTGFTAAAVIGLDESAFTTMLSAACSETGRFPGLADLREKCKVGADETARGDDDSARQLIELAGVGRRILEVGLRKSASETVSQILYFRDVTHEKEVERLKSEFLSTAAHELRTPMASIYGFTELLLTQEFAPEEQRDFLETIFRQSGLMISIINELLDLARIEARRGKDFVIERVPLDLLVRETCMGFKPPAGRAAPHIADCAQDCWVRADRKKLAQAISNVIANAYKYSPEGGEVEIGMLTSHANNAADCTPMQRVGVRIADQGIGMTPEQRARVCERFYRADTSGKIPGTGLGMSIVKEIIELLGGNIQIESNYGTGTAVVLWLPAATSDPATAPTAAGGLPSSGRPA